MSSEEELGFNGDITGVSALHLSRGKEPLVLILELGEI